MSRAETTSLPPAPVPADDGRSVPSRRGLVVGLSVLAGFLLTAVWSAEFVDRTIGDTVANGLLGHDAKQTPITGAVAGIAFAFVSGIAGTFTACNIAVFGAVAPLLGGAGGRRRRIAAALRPLGWMAAGMLAVSCAYGAVVGLAGASMPQFSTAQTTGIPPRLVQSMVVFGLIGAVMIWLGLAALRLVPDPLARVSRRFPPAPMVLLGVLIGGFLIGRPFPLFRQMFRDAAQSGDPLYGAAAFALQSIGNTVVMAVLLLALTLTAGPSLHRWFSARPARLPTVTAVAMLVAGAFTVLYWDLRVPSRFDLIPWYPTAPWA